MIESLNIFQAVYNRCEDDDDITESDLTTNIIEEKINEIIKELNKE